ncbi:hypothetical protein KQ313_03345 [Synechococcus sp. CS-1325]|uniref:hypothetical protein n=1 Tax=unclassified Synechococcus TaxID=2626047 RepID=UPI000DB61ABB|nr:MULTISPECIES: hypothetical protein [unclassified Synechococcus]PZV02082.1 MAG: hypothetical protein DCF24_02430 [Cyanobium sp.]MCT0198721.1 hypothetical protein [Synechococcus sp. CS-1325]MCT0212938.1 hypothetical protein [Synechococcus sp. CS-1326]MCT0231518.1 hypothetical protein [Synechococcus sp. CS-1324]MCT0233142.1 hypothetical protein [Synechococcus sp. CS-1327]
MSYEPGTSECRLLIDSKEQIEAALANLIRLENTDHIRMQLLAVYNQLEGLHDLRRAQRQSTPEPAGAGRDETG